MHLSITNTPVNTDRIRQLAHCAADGKWSEFHMSIPPRPDHDADLVLTAAADEIDRLRAENAALKCRPSSESPGVQGLAQLGRNCIDRVIELETWKRGAIAVLEQWDAVHDALGKPGKLVESKAEASRKEADRLRTEIAALKDPAVVLCNMMRGTIATPSPAALADLFGANLTDLDAANLRIAELTAALRECLDEIRECDDMTGVRARAISALVKEGVK